MEEAPGPLNPFKIESFGLGSSGRWVRLGKGVLGRTMPFAITVVVLEAILGGLLAWRTPGDLFAFSLVSLGLDGIMFLSAVIWAHLHPAQAASEGNELAQVINAQAFATKTLGYMPASANTYDPLTSQPKSVMKGEAHGTMSSQPAALPVTTVTLAPPSL